MTRFAGTATKHAGRVWPHYMEYKVDANPTKHGTGKIGRHAAENFLHAIRFARSRGRPMNTFVTLSFTDLGLSEAEASGFFSAVRTAIARAWKRFREVRGRDLGTFDDVHAHEYPEGGRRHVHWMMHRPKTMSRAELVRHITDRVMKRTGLDDLGTALLFQHEDEVRAPGTLAKYILKGIDPAYAGYLHIEPEDMGWVTGRRTGTSRSIGRAARKAANWNRKADAARRDNAA